MLSVSYFGLGLVLFLCVFDLSLSFKNYLIKTLTGITGFIFLLERSPRLSTVIPLLWCPLGGKKL